MGVVQRLFLSALKSPGASLPIQWLTRDHATIFMLHRFAVPDRAVEGIAIAQLRETLAYLRRRGYELLSISDVFKSLRGERAPLRKAVAFSIDDGYFDQGELAVPVFAEFECPLTIFVCTGFVDRKLWMWWDKIEYLFEQTARRSLSFRLGDERVSYSWATPLERKAAQYTFTEACKRVPDSVKHGAIHALAEAAEIDTPQQAPDRYAALTWDSLRESERLGMRVAPHTVTHPILSRTPDDQLRYEIEESVARLHAEDLHPEAIFCYPNGQRGDLGTRECDLLAALGFEGAVVSWPGYATRAHFRGGGHERFQVNRFGYPQDLRDTIQCVVGFERLKAAIRGGY